LLNIIYNKNKIFNYIQHISERYVLYISFTKVKIPKSIEWVFE
jgi:hypothetical protein